ncbi:MAG: hypothetical protein A4E40_00146 [Methanoregulaceae archaeon PtaU1.Bin059]|nr:MAG: hypothetical protein A4E39_01658 [Methanoregulaceae archaeon PtaB.Bin152]OPY43436.1 MAG: hypothetical protein A4E40_00146 [Methanoregulaceae archaeon PtaU1.Bin059]
MLGFSHIKLQTAGYSAQARAEITREGIVAAEDLRETIRSLIRESRKVSGPSDATGTQTVPRPAVHGDGAVLEEVREIRRLLERIAKKY